MFTLMPIIMMVLYVERQEERLKTNNRDLSMVSDTMKFLFVSVQCI